MSTSLKPRPRTLVKVALASVIAGLLATVGIAAATPPSGLVVETLADGHFLQPTDIKTTGAGDMVIWKLTFEPQGMTGWHYHPGIVMLTVTTGTVTRTTKTGHRCVVEVFNAGDSFIKTGTDVLNVVNTGTVTASITATFIKPAGTPVLYDAPNPGC